MTKRSVSLFAALLIAIFAFGSWVTWYIYSQIPESHARSCLIVNADLADRAINEEIPEGSYLRAVKYAEGILLNYPVGSVLPEGHPYAAEYKLERQKQLDRIVSALKEATGMDYGSDWEAWRNALSGSIPASSPNGRE